MNTTTKQSPAAT